MNTEIRRAIDDQKHNPENATERIKDAKKFVRFCLEQERIIWREPVDSNCTHFILRNHELFGIYLVHPFDPFGWFERLLSLLCSLFLALFVTAIKYEWSLGDASKDVSYYLGSIVVVVITYAFEAVGTVGEIAIKAVMSKKVSIRLLMIIATIISSGLFIGGVFWIISQEKRYADSGEFSSVCPAPGGDLLYCAFDTWFMSLFVRFFVIGIIAQYGMCHFKMKNEFDCSDKLSKFGMPGELHRAGGADPLQWWKDEFEKQKDDMEWEPPENEKKHQWDEFKRIEFCKCVEPTVSDNTATIYRVIVFLWAVFNLYKIFYISADAEYFYPAQDALTVVELLFSLFGAIAVYYTGKPGQEAIGKAYLKLYCYWLCTLPVINVIIFVSYVAIQGKYCEEISDQVGDNYATEFCESQFENMAIGNVVPFIFNVIVALVAVFYYNWLLDHTSKDMAGGLNESAEGEQVKQMDSGTYSNTQPEQSPVTLC